MLDHMMLRNYPIEQQAAVAGLQLSAAAQIAEGWSAWPIESLDTL